MDRLLLHHSLSHPSYHPLHHRLRIIQQTYPIFHSEHYLQVNYPVQSTGKICYLELNTTPFIYFRNMRDFTKQRFCVSACPKIGQQIKCNPGTNCAGIVSTYDTSETIHNLGGYCVPTDQSLLNSFWSNEAIKSKVNNVYYFNIVL